jgi:hypothetical protein
MQVYGMIRGTAPLALNLGTRWRWVVDFTPCFTAEERTYSTYWIENWRDPEPVRTFWIRDELLPVPGIELHNRRSVDCSLFQIHYSKSTIPDPERGATLIHTAFGWYTVYDTLQTFRRSVAFPFSRISRTWIVTESWKWRQLVTHSTSQCIQHLLCTIIQTNIHLRAWAFGVIFLFSLSQTGELLMWLHRNKASVCTELGKNHRGQAAILWQIQTRVHRATSGCEHY